VKHESPRGGLRATGQVSHQDTDCRRPPEGGRLELAQIGSPLTDAEIRLLGFEPAGWRGWSPRTQELADQLHAADARRTDRALSFVYVPFRIPGDPVACAVCGEDAPPSTVGTPTCSAICTAVLMDEFFARNADALFTRGDGSGGHDAVRPITPARPRKRLSVAPTGSFSVEQALERLGDCRTVLERHGVAVRWGRIARCPFHPDEHPSMSLYERAGKSRAHCFPCDWSGDALDLEAALTGEDLPQTIRRWGGN
jgi:CHC2 zinc finger